MSSKIHVVQTKKKFSNQSFSDLPNEVIWQILCRLPIKTSLKCKLVCKEWYDIIISPRFTELRTSYCSNSIPLLFHCYLPNRKWRNFMLVEFGQCSETGVDLINGTKSNTDAVIKFKSKFNLPHHRLYVGNVCNGLVCVKSDAQWGCYYICNLLTSQCVMVEQPRKRYHSVCGYGLGFCATTRKYKVLRFLEHRFFGENVVEVLTLGTDIWRSVGGAPKSYYKSGPFMNGSLHWYCSRSKCILAFHFGTEQFLCVPLPDEASIEQVGFRSNLSENSVVTTLDSCLCFSCKPTYDGQYEVWVMKEYGVKDSWVRLCILPSVPLLRMNNGQILLRKVDVVALYNPETGAFTEVNVPGVSFRSVHICEADFSSILAVV